jgi:hypothetical protein
VSLIRARLHTCRCVSIYRFGERGLGWERDHELDPRALAQLLEQRGERADTVAQVLAMRELVARWRGDRPALVAAIQTRAARPTARHPIPLRPGDATIARYRRTAVRGAVLAMFAIVAAVLAAIFTGWFAVAAVVPLVAALMVVTRARSSARRLIRQRVAAGFLRPSFS